MTQKLLEVEVDNVLGQVARVFIDQVTNSGELEPVEAYVERDKLYPLSDWSWVTWFVAGALSMLGLEIFVFAIFAVLGS